ncbi:hypothetical protein DPMN_180966 [Dreissena polymorpha]|uniref:Uncharacterized protein n=1 Tax=Dreissena polymorpha TaxID=45954 RepID=A0A9D4DEC1_DREPO|nr:hypothetical protein DPMN_180966 [Dreissena polymorpha]
MSELDNLSQWVKERKERAYEREERNQKREIKKLEMEREMEMKILRIALLLPQLPNCDDKLEARMLELTVADANDYQKLKDALLKRFNLNEDGLREKERKWLG